MLKTYKILISGQVQGVGFRPFVYSLATEFSLLGTVSNNEEGVIIFVSGIEKNIQILALEKEKSQLEERTLKIVELESKNKGLSEELKEKYNETTSLEKRIAELATSIEKERESSIEKLAILENSKEDLKNEFKNLSNEILEEKSKRFTEKNKEKIN